jgi:hypothetical protein
MREVPRPPPPSDEAPDDVRAAEDERSATVFFLETNVWALETGWLGLAPPDERLVVEYLRLLAARIRRGEHVTRYVNALAEEADAPAEKS